MFENTETVLVVDDEISDLETMQKLLSEQGYTVLHAQDYPEAFALFERHNRDIDLLLTDISLPGRNGCDLAKALLRLKPHLKVLFVSGHAGAEICRFYDIPKSDLHFFRKPLKPAALLSRVRQVLNSTEPFLQPQESAEETGNGDTRKQF